LSRAAVLLAVLVAAAFGATAWGFYVYFPGRAGQAQPIAFSHRLHATTKQVSCLFCHDQALDQASAGIPSLQTCMLCHQQVIIDHPEVRKLREHYSQGKPVEWVKVNYFPEFVFFNHQIHVRRGFDCSRCHGNVAEMDRVKPPLDLQMGFCVQCHRDNGASHDCLVCHR
jgi:hypothetical protein